VIAIEQPELHLHPSLQSKVADILIESCTKRNNFFLVETHSEHLLLRVMKRMRQTAEGTLEDENLRLTPDDVAVLYVDNDGEKTYILELELDEDGTLLDPWPGGFFEEGFAERFF
jgi:predicted ATPase